MRSNLKGSSPETSKEDGEECEAIAQERELEAAVDVVPAEEAEEDEAEEETEEESEESESERIEEREEEKEGVHRKPKRRGHRTAA